MDGDLRRREADAVGAVHGLEHVVGELADAVVDSLDRLGNEPQPLVREFYDVAHSHGARCKAVHKSRLQARSGP